MDLRKLRGGVDIGVANAGAKRTSEKNNAAPKADTSRSASDLDSHVVSFFMFSLYIGIQSSKDSEGALNLQAAAYAT